VVGINTAIAPQGQGIGFAIPASLASEVIDALRSGGKVVRGWLGIAFQPVDEDLATAFGLEEPGGAVVVNVTEGSPAEKGGVRTGDVIVAVDGEDLRSARRLPSAVAKLAPGERVPFVVIRDGKRRTIRIEIGEMPGDLAGAIRRPRSGEGEEETGDLGFSVRPLDDRLRERLGAEDVEGGVVVGSVEPGSAASRALRSGDVIVEVNRDPIRDEEDFEEKVSGTKEGDDLLLLVYRRGSWLYLVLRP